MQLQTEVFISIDGLEFNKIDLSKNESILMKYVLKDTTDLSTIFSPYSIPFTFPGTLHNQKIFGFVGNTKVYKTKIDNVFSCKIYSNGLLSQTGKLKLTEVREEMGRVKSFTANFTTTMISLKSRMGDELINDLPKIPAVINWFPNDVFDGLGSIKNIADVGYGISSKYYVPLISRERVFQRKLNTDGNNYLDNVAYNFGINPLSNNCLKSNEFRPAIQGRTILDLIFKKYNLDIEMPLTLKDEFNDWFIYCNAEVTTPEKSKTIDIIKPFELSILSERDDRGGDGLPDNPRYGLTVDLSTNIISIVQDNSFYPDRWGGDFELIVKLNNVLILDNSSSKDFLITIKKTDGRILSSETYTSVGSDLNALINITDSMFLGTNLDFTIEILPKQITSWSTMDISIIQEYYHSYKYFTVKSLERRKWQYLSALNANSTQSGAGTIDLFKALPKVKCFDFLFSFFKTFNISVFDASPNNDKLFWITPQDLLVPNQEFSKKEVDYTPYIVSQSVQKSVAADYNYYNFKHLTSKYKSNVDYLATYGYEFGQLAHPLTKPTIDLNEFKVETTFSILPAVPITGMNEEFTSYGFTSDAPETLETGEKRYKPNSEELTIFFARELRSLTSEFDFTYQNALGFQKIANDNSLFVAPLLSYIKTSPVHPNGFSFGFGLIQEATQRSLYADFYREQTERLLEPNCLKHSFELELPASELVLNYATTTQGQGLVPDGFRLQNEIILQEQRFSVIEAQIDVTTGKSKMNLLNFL